MMGPIAAALRGLSIVLLAAGCASVSPPPPPSVESIVSCQPWRHPCPWCRRLAPPRPGAEHTEDVSVVLHLMIPIAMDQNAREFQYRPARAWQLGPEADAILDRWTPQIIQDFFGPPPDGRVREIWKRQDIRLTLLRVEECLYRQTHLRLDGRPRDSMFTPDSHVPWASELFRSINRILVADDPRELHVVVWWSLDESDYQSLSAAVVGYGRSAARGGPAAWVEALYCLPPVDPAWLPDEQNYEGCARLVAHEIGHALSLLHVDGPSTNLMNSWYSGDQLTDSQKAQAHREARRQFRH